MGRYKDKTGMHRVWGADNVRSVENGVRISIKSRVDGTDVLKATQDLVALHTGRI